MINMGKYDYTNAFNKQNYKTYSFRVRKDDLDVINKLDNIDNKNKFITSLIKENIHPSVLTIKQIRERLKPVIEKHGIKEVYLFGSYARGEATSKSDIDLYCDSGDVRSLYDHVDIIEEFENALGKEVDLIFIGTDMHPFFKEQLDKDKLRIY